MIFTLKIDTTFDDMADDYFDTDYDYFDTDVYFDADYKTNTLILKKEIQDYYQDKVLEEVEEFFLLNKSPAFKTKNTENAPDKSLSENEEGISDYIADTFHKQTECTQNKDSTYDKNETKYVNKIEHETKHETESQVVSGLYENSSDVNPQNIN